MNRSIAGKRKMVAINTIDVQSKKLAEALGVPLEIATDIRGANHRDPVVREVLQLEMVAQIMASLVQAAEIREIGKSEPEPKPAPKRRARSPKNEQDE